MIELRFHKALYSENALLAAVAAYEGFVRVERADEGQHMIARLTSVEPDTEEAETAGEFANYVLGLTVDARAPEGQKS
jgi:hypothetical protein